MLIQHRDYSFSGMLPLKGRCQKEKAWKPVSSFFLTEDAPRRLERLLNATPQILPRRNHSRRLVVTER